MATKERRAKGKKFNLFLSEEEHRILKTKSALQGTTMQQYLLRLLHKDTNTDTDWNNFMKAWENAEEEEPDELDIEISKRGKIEIANGEVEDYEDVMGESEAEDESKIH